MTDDQHPGTHLPKDRGQLAALSVALLILCVNTVVLLGFLLQVTPFIDLATFDTTLVIGGIEALLIAPCVYGVANTTDERAPALEGVPTLH